MTPLIVFAFVPHFQDAKIMLIGLSIVAWWQADYNAALMESLVIRSILHRTLRQLHNVVELPFQHIASPRDVPFCQRLYATCEWLTNQV